MANKYFTVPIFVFNYYRLLNLPKAVENPKSITLIWGLSALFRSKKF